MSLAVITSRAGVGIEAPEVTVEVHLGGGLPSLSIVGLPEAAVKESKDRVRGALLTCRFEFPTRRITINLAPADLPKDGARFDLPIALGILAASGQIPTDTLSRYEFIGELALNGTLRPIRGVIPVALKSRAAGRTLVVPQENAEEAGKVRNTAILPSSHLLQLTAHLAGQQPLDLFQAQEQERPVSDGPDLAEVRGQYQAKRALTIAAAGMHNVLFFGPPGTGKTMLASRLPGILPPMSDEEAVASAAIASISGTGFDPVSWGKRPFRAPHHTASGVALVGGGGSPRPGEISLAHNGVLFLDELPEFDRRVLEVLREPLESGRITISRAARQAEYPARFQLVAAMNPCPCGYLGHPNGRCHCTIEQISRYRGRISGPLIDRIDLQVEVPPLPHTELRTPASSAETSQTVREQVKAAHQRQLHRANKLNSRLSPDEIDTFCSLDAAGRTLIDNALKQLGLSARAYHRILKVARTIADIEENDTITAPHLAEAISYRRMDRPIG